MEKRKLYFSHLPVCEWRMILFKLSETQKIPNVSTSRQRMEIELLHFRESWKSLPCGTKVQFRHNKKGN